MVESVLTPPTVSGDRRASQTGRLSFSEEIIEPTSSALPIPNSNLHPSSVDPMRNSYMTTSTASRMSDISDFPAPPRQYDSHMSLLSSYFDDEVVEAHTSRGPTPPIALHPDVQDRFLDGDEDVEAYVSALSHHSHSSHSHS